MNFEAQRLTAVSWLKSHPDFELIFADEETGSFLFCNNQLQFSFTVICPGKSPENWAVVTDNSNYSSFLSKANDYCETSTSKTLGDLLKCINCSTMGLDDSDSCSNEDNESDDADDYFYNDDLPEDETVQKEVTDAVPEEKMPYASRGSAPAVNRLIIDMKNLQKSEGKYGLSGNPRGDNLFIWDIQLSDFPRESRLSKDLESYAKKFKRKPVIEMEMRFPDDYPFSPPFVRVIRPRFEALTGHVTIGGSVCMQVLTKSGWSPSNDIESVLIQVRATIMSDPNARLAWNSDKPYTEEEARDAFNRMVAKYGWNK